MNRNCLVSKYVSLMKQWQKVVWVSICQAEDSVFNDCDEATVGDVVHWHETPVLDLISGSVAHEEITSSGDFRDSNPNH